MKFDPFDWTLYGIIVAGKRASFAQSKVEALKREAREKGFKFLRKYLASLQEHEILDLLQEVRTGPSNTSLNTR